MKPYDRKYKVASALAEDNVSYRDEENDTAPASMSAAPAAPMSAGQPVTPDTSGANTASTVGSGMMMTGNPYLMAAGLGLQVVGQAKERELKREAQNVNNEIARRDTVMQLMSKFGQGMGRIG